MREALIESSTQTPRTEASAKSEIRKIPAEGADFNEVESVILQRRSVRNYRKTQVPEHVVKRVLECARFAPSAGNNQSWKFIVLRDPELIVELTDYTRMWAQRMSKLTDPTYPGSWTTKPTAAAMKVLFSAFAPSLMHPTGLTGLAQFAKGELGLWHGAPTVILLLYDKRGTGKPQVDLGIAGQNMVLAAHSMGLGTCWVSFAMFIERNRQYKKLLGIEYPWRFATSLCLGYPLARPDGFVQRDTHATPWFEPNGEKRIVY